MNIVIEVQGTDNNFFQKQSLATDQRITIGRSWQSDVIVQDDCVDASHFALSLSDEGRLLITDLHSENGVLIANKRLKKAVLYQFGDVIRIGNTCLRIYDVNQAVKPALPISVWQLISRQLSSRKSLLLSTLAMVCALVLQAFFAQADEFRFADFLTTAFGVVISLFIWSIIMGFIGRLFRHQANTKAHWSFGCLAIVAIIIIGLILEILQFNLPSPLFKDVSEQLFLAAMIAVFVYGTLSFTSFLNHPSKLAWSLLLSIMPLLAFFVMPLFEEEHEQWSAWGQTTSTAMPPAFVLRRPTALNDYIQDVDRLFDQLNADLKE